MSERGIRRAHARRLNGSRRVAGVAAGAVLGAGALLVPSAQAATVTVTNLNDTGAGSLRDTISAAAPGDTVNFNSGLSGTVNVASEILVDKALTIQGPGASTVTVDGGDNNRIFRIAPTTGGDPVSISGLTFANGNAGSDSGGAILATNTNLTLDSATIRDSAAGANSGSFKYDGGGGGLAVFGGSSTLTVTDSRIADNTSTDYGGGIETASLQGDVTITGSTLSGNVAAEYGGGLAIYDQSADVTITESTVSGNDGGTRDGGGIWFEDVFSGGAVTVSDSTFSANETDRAGGGMSFGENFSGPVLVSNSTVSGNSAADGGGVQFADLEPGGSFALDNSTVTGNSAANSAGGVLRGYHLGSGSPTQSDVIASSTIIAGNTAASGNPDVGQNPGTTGTLTLTNSLLQTTAAATYAENPVGSNVLGADPMLGPLADNGGPTQTELPTAASPVVNAGLANSLPKDQRGLTRTVDYPGVAATHGSDGTDIGAAELQIPPPPPPAPDTEVKDPFLSMESPQIVDPKNIELQVQAGAGEPVTGQVYGVITIGLGNAVQRTTQVSIPMNGRQTITVVPKSKAAKRRIAKALSKGRKVQANLTGKLVDAASNEYTKQLTAKLRLRKGG